ncbi:MAG: SusC/RagA family protein [Paludibacter sp. 47-17]|nr:MAG: SusC/RagA family protein [Paludibacter sp. 47-17]
MKRKIIFLSVLLLFGVYLAFAQQSISVSGVVTDAADGSPLIGVSVTVKGTNRGTITDIQGRYRLETRQGAVLVYTYVGMKKQEITVRNQVINVLLEAEALMLDEVVTIGYGTARKSDLSGASVTVGENVLKSSVIANLDQALQGRVAGVTAVTTSGQPGSAVSIRVRGQGTINASAEPLYVIDGVPVGGGSNSGASFGLGDALGNGSNSAISVMSTINPADIISMEVLKDASATAIYGSRASNGVILITTKRGKAGEAKFNYEGLYGYQRQAKRLDIMNLREFAEYSNSMAGETAGRDVRDEFRDPSLLGNGTNWQDAIFQIAPMQSHTVSASGGNDLAKYFISGSYLGQEGTVIGTTFDRIAFRTNLDAQLKKWLKLGVNINYSNTNERLGLVDSDEGIMRIALLSTPDVPIYDIDGNYTSISREGVASRINPIAKALDEDNILKRSYLNGNIFADITLMKGLTLHSDIAVSISGSDAERFRPTATYGSWQRLINSNSRQHNQGLFWQLKNYLTYDLTFDLHKLNVMAGQEMMESNWEYQSISATNLPDNSIHNPALGADPKIGYGFGSSAMASVFTRANYSYNEKYYGTYTFRYDASSNFGPLNRWAPFHSFAASWRFTNEDFMQDANYIVSNGKLRIGWGQTGNQEIGGYAWGASISKMETGLGVGYRQSNIANPRIQWEKQEQVNVGLDLGLFNDRITIVIDAYDKTSRNMLMPLQLPSYMGTRGNVSSALAPPRGNYGTINNKGLEITLGAHLVNNKDFSWDSDLQLSFNKNTLVGLDGTSNAFLEGYGQWTDVVSRSGIGESLYNFYGYRVEGIYKDLNDIKSWATAEKYPEDGKSFSRTNTVYPGDLKFKDISGPDGKPDGKITEHDRTFIGSPLPLFTYGFNNTLRYRNIDLTVFVNGTYGNKVLNYVSRNLTNMESLWDNQLAVVTDRARLEPIDPAKTYPRTNSTGAEVNNWFDDIDNVRVANTGASVPRAIQNDPNDNNRLSDRYIEDGSYLRLKNLIVGYTFQPSVLKRLHLTNLRVYANVQNLFTLTSYSGFDPEIGVSTASPNVYGLDNGRYPSPQIYTVGLNLSF